MKQIVFFFFLLVGMASAAADQTQTRSMPFEACKKLTAQTASNYGVPAKPIMRNETMWVTKYDTDDGEVTITCSKPDHKVIIRQSKGFGRL